MVDATYQTALNKTVLTVEAILKADATLTALVSADSIYTYVSNSLRKGTGFPQINIYADSPSDEEFTFSKFQVGVQVRVECFSRMTDVLRQIVDAVRSALHGAETTSEGVKLRGLLNRGGSFSPSVLDDETIVYSTIVAAEYTFYGVAP
jgi:hypothetical protein